MNSCNSRYAEEESSMNNDCNYSSKKLYELVLEDIRETIKDKHHAGVTQERLANELGITREHLTRILNGEYIIRSDYLFYLIVELGLNKTYFNR